MTVIHRRRVAGLVVATMLALTTPAAAQQPSACASPVLTEVEAAQLLRVDTGELQRLAEAGGVPARRIGSAWRFECAALLDWLKRDVAPATPEQSTPVGEAPEERTAEDVFLRGNRLLLGRGDVVIDIGQFYVRRDALQLVVADGSIGLATAEQSGLATVLVGRVGVFPETELFAATGYTHQAVRQLLGNATLASTSRSVIGPSSVGIRRTLLRENVRRPDVVVSTSGQIPTRDAWPAVTAGLVAIKSLDPVVLFANGNYTHPFERGSPSRRPMPVDTVDLSFGYGLGLNDTTAISMAVGALFAERPGDSAPKPPSTFSARFSLTTSLGAGLYLEPSFSFSLSGPAHSFAFGLTMPYAF